MTFQLHELPYDVLVQAVIPAACSTGSLKELLQTLLVASKSSNRLFRSLSEDALFWRSAYLSTFPEPRDVDRIHRAAVAKMHRQQRQAALAQQQHCPCPSQQHAAPSLTRVPGTARSFWHACFVRRSQLCESCLTLLRARDCDAGCCARCCASAGCRRHRYAQQRPLSADPELYVVHSRRHVCKVRVRRRLRGGGTILL